MFPYRLWPCVLSTVVHGCSFLPSMLRVCFSPLSNCVFFHYFIVGRELSSSLPFVGCGVQLRFEPLCILSGAVLTSFRFRVVASPPYSLICLGLCKVAIVSLCAWAIDLPWPGGCFLVVEVADILWVLSLSCFGRVRAKNKSELPCGLELCSLDVWD